VESICNIYLAAEKLEEENIHVISTDEKTGIQAKEHANPKKLMQPGKPEFIDPEYIRHGTICLIASRNVATGDVVAPYLNPTRKEEDFLHHVENVVQCNPGDKHIFIVDNLNIHKSESLVKLTASLSGIDESTLGKKGSKGILKNMDSRATFLQDMSHQIVFIYTPKHCSWLNQIECWFSILSRRLLNKRSSFLSVEDLKNKISEFIDFYNKYLKKPFQWNYSGKLLKV